MKKIESMTLERYKQVRKNLSPLYDGDNKARARARRIEKTALRVYEGLDACGGRMVIPFPFA